MVALALVEQPDGTTVRCNPNIGDPYPYPNPYPYPYPNPNPTVTRSEGGEPLPLAAGETGHEDAAWLSRNLGSRAIGVLAVTEDR